MPTRAAESQSDSEVLVSDPSQRFEPREDNDSDTFYKVVEITGETKDKYKVRWKGNDPKTRKPWPQSCIPKGDCTGTLVLIWNSKKIDRNSTSSKRASPPVASTAINPKNNSPPVDARLKSTKRKHKLDEALSANSSTNQTSSRHVEAVPFEVDTYEEQTIRKKVIVSNPPRKKRRTTSDSDGPAGKPWTHGAKSHDVRNGGTNEEEDQPTKGQSHVYDEEERIVEEALLEGYHSAGMNDADDESWNDDFEVDPRNGNLDDETQLMKDEQKVQTPQEEEGNSDEVEVPKQSTTRHLPQAEEDLSNEPESDSDQSPRPEKHRKPQKFKPTTKYLRDVSSIQDSDECTSEVILNPRARQKLAIFDAEVMGKRIRVREVNGKGEVSALKRSSSSGNCQVAPSIRHPSPFDTQSSNMDVVPAKELKNPQEGKLPPPPAAVKSNGKRNNVSPSPMPGLSVTKPLQALPHISSLAFHPRLPPNLSLPDTIFEPSLSLDPSPDIGAIEQFESLEKDHALFPKSGTESGRLTAKKISLQEVITRAESRRRREM